jgi:hypothetical protein
MPAQAVIVAGRKTGPEPIRCARGMSREVGQETVLDRLTRYGDSLERPLFDLCQPFTERGPGGSEFGHEYRSKSRILPLDRQSI